MAQGARDRMLTAGIDVGSAIVKVVVVDTGEDGGEHLVVGRAERIRRRDVGAVAASLYRDVLAEGGVPADALSYLATTGEAESVPFRTGHFYGMTTHARGGLFLEPDARAIIDMGALHTRAVAMDGRGKVLGYRMTSQCASGSGQFLENIARYLGVSLQEIGGLSRQATKPETCSSICAVLAETDVINMVSRGISLPDILKGIHLSMAGRAVKLVVSIGSPGVVLLTGGLAGDEGLVAAMREAAASQGLTVDVRAHGQSILAGALGAALWGAYRARRLRALEGRAAS
ncbi:MAG TPA: benzoyl-CoA reductase subunit D [Vicinamibacterales bacterium]|nr:benzoyl-CoA reductase subunit D [Vicinamibacterales bacterium]